MCRSTRPCLTWLIALLVIGCAAPGDDLPLSSPPEPGSAVVNREPAWTRATRWTISRSPVVEIGGKRGKGPQDLLKVTGVARLYDGTVVVGNGSTGELKYFDRNGVFITSAGGIGPSPGSFRVLGWIRLLESGEIVAFDESLRTLSVFDGEGAYVRSLLANYDPRANGAFFTIVGVFEDESVLIHQSRIEAGQEGAQRSDDWFVHVPVNGVPKAVTDAWPGTELVRRNYINARHVSQPPFGRSLHTAIAPTRFYVGDNDRYAISAFAPDGALLHVVQLEGAERAVTADVIDEYMDVRLQPNPDLDRKVLEPPLRAMITHGTMPAFDGLLADQDGYLWVRDFDFRLPADREERWNVFDPNGRYLGALEMPTGFALMTVGPRHLAGVSRDKLGAERVRIFELTKPDRK